MAVVRDNPEYGFQEIAEAVRKSSNPPMKIEARLISEFLKRKGLGDVAARKAISNEVDRV